LRRALPGLILTHNLHGIDIDLRAVQITQLALWLRAQRAFADYGIHRDNRPRITRSNIVCAEPMPGEQDMLEEYVANLPTKELRELVREVFDKMQLAGEAGSLLKIEQHISGAVKRAVGDLGLMFAEQAEERWHDTERQLLEALERYARSAGANGLAFQRTLFTEDAAQGLAFIDVCSKIYSVVLMNPPFGAPSVPSKQYIEKTYPRTKNDLYAAFVERGLELLHRGGMLGAITSRTGFFLSSFQKWREEIILKEARPTVVADLGMGVLDTALVETVAYCLEAVK
jgi:GNAT superfamily N-acetyltransferase